ncbi:MAG: oxygen-dependent coproporphyrinogen oxidase [Cytophagales bacterium]|nr:MAG: oxygen-dependent coproporphyrinogen oxidase [Cytophagales bacterium]
MNKEQIEDWFKTLQNNICEEIALADGKGNFEEDHWDRADGGGGITRILRNGNVLVKAGVNFSAVYGSTPENILKALALEKSDFYATGVSIVMHPINPMVPIIHMNTRYFEMSNGVYWFGGGIDLTPHYIHKEDACYFHQELKTVCDQHHKDYYHNYKEWADNYFFIKHRNETRGIGGIFFDRLSESKDISKNDIFQFVKDIGKSFAPIYTHLMQKNKDLPYGDKELYWQSIRRSRYVEFNLVYDKGTKFGLDTNGRTESILMSMPPMAQWEYNLQVEKDSQEEKTLLLLKKGINWVD